MCPQFRQSTDTHCPQGTEWLHQCKMQAADMFLQTQILLCIFVVQPSKIITTIKHECCCPTSRLHCIYTIYRGIMLYVRPVSVCPKLLRPERYEAIALIVNMCVSI